MAIEQPHLIHSTANVDTISDLKGPVQVRHNARIVNSALLAKAPIAVDGNAVVRHSQIYGGTSVEDNAIVDKCSLSSNESAI